MRSLVNRISDRALRIMLPEASAGACIVQTGQVCKCLSEAGCGSGKSTYKVYRVTCTGQCVLSQTICEKSCIVTV